MPEQLPFTRRVWLWSLHNVDALLVATMALALGFVPLFAGPGYESALGTGVFLPFAAALSGAVRAGGFFFSPLRALEAGVSRGALLGLVALLASVVHGIRTGFCSFFDGLELFVLGPLIGSIAAGAWGASAMWLSRGRRRGLSLALAGAAPLASMLVSATRFYTSPLVFAFDPFVGFFSGALYDTVIDGVDRLYSYRVGTACSLLFAGGVAAHLELRPARPRPIVSVLTALSFVGSVAITLAGPQLGHWHTAATIQEELGARLSSERCDVVYPATMRPSDAQLFARDCDRDVEMVAAYLGVARPPRVLAYLFADSSQKRRLMGAADTYIAKPWRREVYVQASGYPHPVLGHELAHVVAGSLGRGPFRVAGHLGGLLPIPGLIEGIAVAASPDDDELSPLAWSKAMLDLGLLPRLESLFSLGFLTQDAGRAYTVAGAFVGLVRERHGVAALGRWYGGESLEAVTGMSWAAHEAAFREHIAALTLPPEALALGKARFDRPAVFGRRCPHEIDALTRKAQGKLASGDVAGALELADELVTRERKNAGARLLREVCLERKGDVARASNELEALAADEGAGRIARNRATERLGDLAFVRGDVAEATRRWQETRSHVLDEDHLRTLDVKLHVADTGHGGDAVRHLLLGMPETGTDVVRASEELGRWAERQPDDGLPRYLLGRNALSRGLYPRALELLREAATRRLEPLRVRREAGRQLVVVGCILGDRAVVDEGLAMFAQTGAPPGNRQALLTSLAARCTAGR